MSDKPSASKERLGLKIFYRLLLVALIMLVVASLAFFGSALVEVWGYWNGERNSTVHSAQMFGSFGLATLVLVAILYYVLFSPIKKSLSGAISSVKLVTNQAAAPKNNDNIAMFIAGAFALGLLTTAIYFMVLRNDVTPSNAMTLPAPMATQDEVPVAETQSAKQKYYYSRDDQKRIDVGLEPLGPFVSGDKFGGIPLSEDDDGVLVALKEVSSLDAAMAEVRAITKKAKDDYQKAVDESFEQLSEDAGIDFSNLVAVPVEESEQPAGIDFSQLEAVAKEQAEKGADVTEDVTPN